MPTVMAQCKGLSGPPSVGTTPRQAMPAAASGTALREGSRADNRPEDMPSWERRNRFRAFRRLDLKLWDILATVPFPVFLRKPRRAWHVRGVQARFGSKLLPLALLAAACSKPDSGQPSAGSSA